MTATNADQISAADRMVRAGNLVGVAEIARRLGIPDKRTTISNWAARREITRFPMHVQKLDATPVYDWSEVKPWAIDWFKAHGMELNILEGC